MCLYKMELYKLIHRKIFIIGIIAAFGIVFLYFLSLLSSEYSVVDGITYTGYEAVQKNREITEEFVGVVTDEKIDRIVEKYGIPSQLVDGLPGWRDGNYLNDFVVRYFTDGSWEQGIVPITRYKLEESELGEICSQYQKTPVLAYTNGWKVFVDLFHFSLMVGSVLVVCSISVVFADEGTKKMISLLFTTKEGKGKGIMAKIMAAFTLTLLILIGITALDFFLCKIIYGLDGFGNMAGIVLSENFQPVFIQDFSNYLSILLVYGVQGFISLCSITLCVSACYNNSFIAVVVASVVWVIPVLFRILFRGLISMITYATPIFLVMNGMINDNYNFWQIIVVISMLISIACLIVGYRKYEKQDV